MVTPADPSDAFDCFGLYLTDRDGLVLTSPGKVGRLGYVWFDTIRAGHAARMQVIYTRQHPRKDLILANHPLPNIFCVVSGDCFELRMVEVPTDLYPS